MSSQGTNSSSENALLYIRKNDTTDYLVGTVVTSVGGYQMLSKTDLSVPVATGDYITMKLVTGAWTTNAVSLGIRTLLGIDC